MIKKTILFLVILSINASAYSIENFKDRTNKRRVFDVSTVTLTATTNATITTYTTLTRLKHWNVSTTSTVSTISTANVVDGTEVHFYQSDSGKTITFNENGNLKMTGATLALNDQIDTISFIYDSIRQLWLSVGWKNND